MHLKEIAKWFLQSLPGVAVTGLCGGIIGHFMGGLIWIFSMAIAGSLLGMVIWRMGGQRFFILVVIGVFLGGMLALYLSGKNSFLLGAAAGGAIGGFLGVNLHLLWPRHFI